MEQRFRTSDEHHASFRPNSKCRRCHTHDASQQPLIGYANIPSGASLDRAPFNQSTTKNDAIPIYTLPTHLPVNPELCKENESVTVNGYDRTEVLIAVERYTAIGARVRA